MVMEITKTNGATMKGTFSKEKVDLDKKVRNCFRENNIDYLGWF